MGSCEIACIFQTFSEYICHPSISNVGLTLCTKIFQEAHFTEVIYSWSSRSLHALVQSYFFLVLFSVCSVNRIKLSCALHGHSGKRETGATFLLLELLMRTASRRLLFTEVLQMMLQVSFIDPFVKCSWKLYSDHPVKSGCHIFCICLNLFLSSWKSCWARQLRFCNELSVLIKKGSCNENLWLRPVFQLNINKTK